MTIEEAIQHCKDVEKEKRYECTECTEVQNYRDAKECNECAEEHRQLAEWLTELKQRREEEIIRKPETNADRIRQMTDEDLADKLTDKCAVCAYHNAECEKIFCLCEEGVLKWLKQEAKEDAIERTD